MNVPIRMIGVATIIFWILLIGYIASAAYSLQDLHFSFGQTQFNVTQNHNLVLSLPLNIDNQGYYSLKDFNITTSLFDATGSEITKASTFVPAIPYGENVTVMHNVTISTDDLVSQGETYLFHDSNLTLSVLAGINFAEFLPAQISTNVSIPWGAPFYNFGLGQPAYAISNNANAEMTVPLSFENHAAFDLTGNIRVELYDNSNSLLSQSQVTLNAPQHSIYNSNFEFNFPLKPNSSSQTKGGHFEVYFSTELFEYGPLVIPCV